MQVTDENQQAAIVTLTLLLGVVVNIHPRRDEVIEAFEKSLKMLDEQHESKLIARRAQKYGRDMVAGLRTRSTRPRPS